MGLEKAGTTIGKEIIAWTKTSVSKSLLATKPVKVSLKGLKLATPIQTDTLQISLKNKFNKDWEFVKDAYESFYMKPLTCGYNVDISKLTETEKCIATYIGDNGFYNALNSYCRTQFISGFSFLNKEVLPKYKDALKYAFENTPSLKSYKGTTYRWQPEGAFERTFKKVKKGDIIEEPAFLSTSDNIISCDFYREENTGIYLTPELIIIKGKNGKKIPKKLAGWNAFEDEILYNANTKYRYIETKKIENADELGLEQYIREHKNKKNIKFKPCNAIYLEEI